MSGRRSSIDGGPTCAQNGLPPPSKPKMHLALLKLSTANAFVKALSAANAAKKAGSCPTSLSQEANSGSGGSLSLPDVMVGFASGALVTAAAESVPPLSPHPRSPYYGMYADYEDIMELLRIGVIADGSARRMLSKVTPEQLVHVAHLGIGACCSVDLVAVHCPNGSRLLAAAKSCYLPPCDPRLRASLREADLLSRCAECPFIIQLLAVLKQDDLLDMSATAGAATGTVSPQGSSSPADTPLRRSLQLTNSGGIAGDLMAGFSGMSSCCVRSGEAGGLDQASASLSVSPTSASPLAASTMVAMMSSPAYQSWAQWRGGGTTEDLEWQIMQRLVAATAMTGGGLGGGSSGGFAAAGSGSSFCGASTGSYGGVGHRGMGSLAGAGQASFGGWYSATTTTTTSNAVGTEDVGEGCNSDGDNGSYGSGGSWGFAAQNNGGGWVNGGGIVTGGVAPRERRCRRTSMDIIDMYGGCTGMGGPGDAPAAAAAAPAEAAEPAVLCTLLLGWARCGDLRRLVQLLLGRSALHQNNKVTGAAPAVSGLPPLVPEDAARFYTGCLVLALEHLHSRLHTVHRDLKLANLLLLENGYVVVGDLGTAVDLSTVPGGKLNSRVGSPGHMAPECRDREEAGYDTAADMWSVGACLFSLLTGQLPAGLAGPPHRQWSPPMSRYWSHELQVLMGRLLAWSPNQRPTAAQLLHDPWFRSFNWTALRELRMQPPSSTPWRELLWWPKENRHQL